MTHFQSRASLKHICLERIKYLSFHMWLYKSNLVEPSLGDWYTLNTDTTSSRWACISVKALIVYPASILLVSAGQLPFQVC